MIRRALWLGGVGAYASLIGYGISIAGASDIVVELVRRLSPALALWLLFRRVFKNRVWTRLIVLLTLFHFTPVIVYILWNIVGLAASMETRFFYPLSESILLLLTAFTVPVALGTPSVLRSALRIGFVACLAVAIHGAFFAWTHPFGGVHTFGITFGLVMVRWTLVFAALAPDHIALEREARTQKATPTCENCEYNLTGNVSGVCPECGTAIPFVGVDSVKQESKIE